MSPTQPNDHLLVWGADGIDPNTLDQATMMAKLPFVQGHVALMPDAHVGKGSTVGSVFATKGAIIPAAIGVDIGCGMAAVKFDISQDVLPELEGLMPIIEKAVPGGVGKDRGWDDQVNVKDELGDWPGMVEGDRGLQRKAISQCGTLGGGNHFFEVCVDEEGSVWLVLHSGSRGVGNILANKFIDRAKGNMKRYFIDLEDQDLAYLVQGDEDFTEYIRHMLWAQDYAFLNRRTMLDAATEGFLAYLDQNGVEGVAITQVINCHHNFTQRENIKLGAKTQNAWITRKGAIKAGPNDYGIVPGSMGTSTYIVQGRGNPASYSSCSHGAGRRFSRTKARRELNPDAFEAAMRGKVWNQDKAGKLLDEAPDAYKNIDAVMKAQDDLVDVKHVLTQVFNYKGTN